MRRVLLYLLSAILTLVLLAAPQSMSATSWAWDAFVYPWVRVCAPWIPGGYADIYNSGPNYGISGNPIEGYNGEYPLDRLTFTFDGANLSVPGETLRTVGGSSAMSIQLALAGKWAVCGNVSGNKWTPDPYATFANDRVIWASNTPNGYGTNLLIGYDFEGNDAAAFDSGYYGYQHPIYGTAMVNWSGFNYSSYTSIEPHSFALQYTPVPEPSTILALLAGLAGIGGMIVRKRT